MNYHRTRYQGRDSLKDPQAQAIKAETPQADRIAARLADMTNRPQIGETYRFDLENGDTYTGEVDEAGSRHAILRPGYSGWLVEDSAPHVSPGSHVYLELTDGTQIYDAHGELVSN